MAESRRQRRLAEARALYEAGTPPDVIARSLGVARSTVRRWARDEARAGRPWASCRPPLPRQDPPPSPTNPPGGSPAGQAGGAPETERLCRLLEGRLGDLIRQSAQEDNPKLDDRILRLCKVIEHLKATGDDLDALLAAMNRFASFCARSLAEEELAPVRAAVRQFLDELKREHSA